MLILKILSGGAAASAVKGIQAAFETDNRCTIEGSFSAVGEMRDALLNGAPCDVVILTRAIIEQLITSGHVQPGSARSLGKVQTGIAVKQGAAAPQVDSPETLAQAFRQAKAIYCPEQDVNSKLREFANGATAMKEMAQCNEPNLIGCTQATEINYTAGVVLVANLPKAFELSTDYTLGVCTQTTQPVLAQTLAAWLTGAQSEQVRRQGGFEF